jgi:cytochrome c553
MLPSPPQLGPRISEWEPRELFYITKHGIKFAGMPAWPSPHRDDEVWAIVAFLRQLPHLDAAGYRRLAYGEAVANADAVPLAGLVVAENTARVVRESCARCHGFDGLGRGLGAFPKLAGQRPQYLYASLQAYARNQRHSGVMEPIAAALGHEEMRELARYYAGLPESSPSAQQATSAIERGRVIAEQGVPRQRVPSCVDCHGPGATRRNPAYPTLAGQYADYLVLQLEIFQKNVRGGTAYAHIMRRAAAGLTSEQVRDVALYYESLVATTEPSAR